MSHDSKKLLRERERERERERRGRGRGRGREGATERIHSLRIEFHPMLAAGPD